MPKCHLIFCEKQGEWAAALRVVAPRTTVPVVETRSLAAARAALGQAPASLIAVHVTEYNLAGVVEFLLAAGRELPLVRCVGLLDAETAAGELLLREAGAIDVLRSVLELPRLGDVADRQAARTPREEPSLQEFVQARLPWNGLATSPLC